MVARASARRIEAILGLRDDKKSGKRRQPPFASFLPIANCVWHFHKYL